MDSSYRPVILHTVTMDSDRPMTCPARISIYKYCRQVGSRCRYRDETMKEIISQQLNKNVHLNCEPRAPIQGWLPKTVIQLLTCYGCSCLVVAPLRIDCFTLLLARHLADVSCYIGPSMPSGICMEIHITIVQKRKKKQSRDEGIPRQPQVYL